ncbi:Chaperone protein Skp [invertebrate metagenome]|uniref:Chaperone protein Skp n=1 Tax=invertebrate metagenome TaxID=1711999 RepID=A0A2H9T7H4_9ZZZZ
MKQLKIWLLALVVVAPFYANAKQAQNYIPQRIAVVDAQMAFGESDEAKRFKKNLDARFSPRQKQLDALQAELQSLQQKFKKDEPTLSKTQRETRWLAIQRKGEDLKIQANQLNEEVEKIRREEIGKLEPKLMATIDAVAKEQNFDIVFRKQQGPIVMVDYVKPEFDITRKVIERLNNAK